MSFSFLPFFLFNSKRCRTMVATTSPPSPHAHAGADRTDPVASATYRPRRLNVRHLLSSPARRRCNRHYPDCRTPPRVAPPAPAPYRRHRSPPLQRPRRRPHRGRFSRRYLNCRHPNRHRRHPSHHAPTVTAPTATATPIPSAPPHQLPPCSLYHLAPTCSTT